MEEECRTLRLWHSSVGTDRLSRPVMSSSENCVLPEAVQHTTAGSKQNKLPMSKSARCTQLEKELNRPVDWVHKMEQEPGLSKPVDWVHKMEQEPGLNKPVDWVHKTEQEPGLSKLVDWVHKTEQEPGLSKLVDWVHKMEQEPGLNKPVDWVHKTEQEPGLSKPVDWVHKTEQEPGLSKPVGNSSENCTRLEPELSMWRRLAVNNSVHCTERQPGRNMMADSASMRVREHRTEGWVNTMELCRPEGSVHKTHTRGPDWENTKERLSNRSSEQRCMTVGMGSCLVANSYCKALVRNRKDRRMRSGCNLERGSG